MSIQASANLRLTENFVASQIVAMSPNLVDQLVFVDSCRRTSPVLIEAEDSFHNLVRRFQLFTLLELEERPLLFGLLIISQVAAFLRQRRRESPRSHPSGL